MTLKYPFIILFISASMLLCTESCSVFNNPAAQSQTASKSSQNKEKAEKTGKTKQTRNSKGKVTAKPVKSTTPNKSSATKKVTAKPNTNIADKKPVIPDKSYSAARPVAKKKSVISAEINELSGEWVIQKVSGQTIKGDNRPYIFFEPEKMQFYGSNGCNIINGYIVSNNTKELAFTDVATSMRTCGQSTKTEFLINNAIADVTNFEIKTTGDESLLNLYSKNGRTLIALSRHNISYVNGAWVVKSINGTDIDNDRLKFIIDLPERKIHGFAGCNIINGKIFTDPDKINSIQFQDITSTRMACPDSSTESNLLIALEEVESCHLMDDNTVVLSTKSGVTKITLEPFAY